MKVNASIIGIVSFAVWTSAPFALTSKAAENTEVISPNKRNAAQSPKKDPLKSSAAPTKNEVYMNHGDIVLEEDSKITKFITPLALSEYGRFQIVIKRPKEKIEEQPIEELAPPLPTLTERIEARRIMHEANQAYFKGDTAKTWELVAEAEKLDPTFYRIKTMKGSLLYKIGSTDLAVEVWLESLGQNPDQPEILKVINQHKEKTQISKSENGKVTL